MSGIFDNCTSLNSKKILNSWKLGPLQKNSQGHYIIPENLLKNNESCNYDLLHKIIKTTFSNIRFKFEGQRGINAGGLSRQVYDLYFSQYLRYFFEDISGFNILKKNVALKKLDIATDKLILLAKRSEIKIFIPINPLLKELLDINITNTNITNTSKLNNLNELKNKFTKKTFNKTYNLLNQKILNELYGNEYNFKNLFLENNKNNLPAQSTNLHGKVLISGNYNVKLKTYIKMYLKSNESELGFSSYSHFEIMYNWYNHYKKNFVPNISFKKDDFFKRIIIVPPGSLSHNGIILSELKSENLQNYKNDYLYLSLIIDYISVNEENRKKFNAYVTGSKNSTSVLKLFLIDQVKSNLTPIHAHTCFNYLNIYKIVQKSNKSLSDYQSNLNILINYKRMNN